MGSIAHLRGTERLIDRRGVERILAVGKTKAYELMHSGLLGPLTRIGATLRVSERAVLAYRDSCTFDPLG